MIKQIQNIVQNYLEARKLTESVYGTVESLNPLKVKIDNHFTVDESFLTFLIKEEKEYLEVGDNLLLLRVQNGQNFIVLSEKRYGIAKRFDDLEKRVFELESR